MAHPLSISLSGPMTFNDLHFLNSTRADNKVGPFDFFPTMNDPSYRMKSLLDGSAGSLVSHTIAEEGSEEEEDHSGQNQSSGRFDSVSRNMDGGSDVAVACNACGFESTFVHEGMTPCTRCRAVFYCSTHCRSWDWNSGGHREACQQLHSGSSHSIDRHSSRETESASSLEADSLFECVSSIGGTAGMSPIVEKQRQGKDNTTRPSKKNLSSFLDNKPKAQTKSALPNPFANMKDIEESEEGESGSYDCFEEESLCVSNLNVSVDAPLNAITEESQVSEAQTADASWRQRETLTPKPRNPFAQLGLGETVSEHESEGELSMDYGNQDPRTLQADDDVAYGVDFSKLGHQSSNSMSANYDCDTVSNEDTRSMLDNEREQDMLLELFDSKATDSSGLLDQDELESDDVSDDIDSANSSSSSLAAMSAEGSTDDDTASHRTLEDRTDSDKSLLKQFREVYNRPETGFGSDDFKSSSQRSTSSLREFREIYNSATDTSESSEEQSENEGVPRSFLGSMHLDQNGDDDLEIPTVVRDDHKPTANSLPETKSTSSALQQARERVRAKKDTLNEALNHYKHKFGESAAVEALDKISGPKGDDDGGEHEFQWERASASGQTKSKYASYRSHFQKVEHEPQRSHAANQRVLLSSAHVPSNETGTSRYLSYKRSLKDPRYQATDQSLPVETESQYTMYRKTLNSLPKDTTVQACASIDEQALSVTEEDASLGMSPSCGAALPSSPQTLYTQYRCRLKKEGSKSDTFVHAPAIDKPLCMNNASMAHTNQQTKCSKYGELLAPTPTKGVSPRTDESSPSTYAAYRASLSSGSSSIERNKKEDAASVIGHQAESGSSHKSRYSQYRSVLTSSASNISVSDSNHQFIKDDVTTERSKAMKASAMTACGPPEQAPMYARYRQTLGTSLSAQALENDRSPDENNNNLHPAYSEYRRNLNALASGQPYDALTEPSNSKLSQSLLGGTYGSYRNSLSSNASSKPASSDTSVDSGEAFSDSSEEQSDSSSAEAKCPHGETELGSKYSAYRASVVPQAPKSEQKTENGVEADVKHSWYRNYRDSLMPRAPKSEQKTENGVEDGKESLYRNYRDSLKPQAPKSEQKTETGVGDVKESWYRNYRDSLKPQAPKSEQKTETGVEDDVTQSWYRNYRDSLKPQAPKSEQKTENGVEDDVTQSWYRNYRDSLKPQAPKSEQKTENRVEDDVTQSWYRNYRDSLSGDGSVGENNTAEQRAKKEESNSEYIKYRHSLHVRFQPASKDEAAVSEPNAETTADISHNSSVDSLEPSQSERMPEVIASPTSRSTSSVTSNTDIDNADATLMPRYLYYKFSLEKAELALKDRTEETASEVTQENICIEKGTNDLGIEENTNDLELEMNGTKRRSDLPPVELTSEMKRDFDLLGLPSCDAWKYGKHAEFLKLWEQVKQDVASTSEERTKLLESRVHMKPTGSFYKPVLPAELPPKKVVMPQAQLQPSVYSNPETDVENQQTDVDSEHGSTSSTGTKCRKQGKFRIFLLLFLRHGIPPLILILFALGIGLAVARSRQDIPANQQSNSPSAAPNAGVDSPSIGQTTAPPAVQAEIYDSLQDIISNISFDGGRALDNVSSPQSLAFNWLLKTPNLFEQYTSDRIIQRYVLVCFYYSTVGDNWLARTNWLTDTNECNWYSLSTSNNVCNENGIYTILDLSFNNLGGFLPPELGLMTELTTLHLTGAGEKSAIDGGVPTELGLLTNLQIVNLRNNIMFGGLPTELGRLTDLTTLDLGMNRFSLNIPSEFGSLPSLKSINLEMNRLTGNLPLEINRLSKLEILALGSNRMSGRVQVGGQLSSLKILNLEQNRFTSISSGLGELSNLEILTMYETDVTGNLQSEISQLVSLKRLSLHSNRLFGRLPDFIGSLKELLDLDLSFNAFSGPIPTHIGKLQNLARLDLRSNFLAGTIPDELSLLTAASMIRLDDNDITGVVSDEVCRSFETHQAKFYSDCGNSEVSCPPESSCCTFCCTDGEGCECTLPKQLKKLCLAN